MSALGHEQTLRIAIGVSALPLKADMPPKQQISNPRLLN
jgi:hypothetical protein